MGTTTAAGTAIAISAAVPATQDAAGYAALTYTEIGGPDQLGTIGATTAKVEFQPLKGAKQKHKGSTDYGSLQPSIALDGADAGQILMQTASNPTNNALYAFLVTYPDGAKRYFQGRVFGYPEDVGNADSIIMVKPTIEINTPIVKVAAA
jgi:hypothetical protein